MPRAFIRPEQFAKILDVHVGTVHQWIRDGVLIGTNVGSPRRRGKKTKKSRPHYRIFVRHAEQFLRERGMKAEEVSEALSL